MVRRTFSLGQNGARGPRDARGARALNLKPDLWQQPVMGFVEIIAYDRHGRILWRIGEEKNLVVRKARSSMAHLIAGDNVTDYYVAQMRFGQGGHDPSNPTVPIPPSVDDTDLFDPIAGSDATQPVTYEFPEGPEGTKVTFSATIPADCDINGTPPAGQAISEAGLFSANGNMFAHKTFGLITKTEEFALTFRWTIVF